MNELIIIIALILLNGLLAMTEIALISVRKSSLSGEAKKGNSSAKMALKLSEEPERFLSTIQIGITLVGILTGLYSGSVIADNFSTVLQKWGVADHYAHLISQTVIVMTVTFFTLIFGELVPKRIGMSVATKVSKMMARPMFLLSMIATPFVWVLARSTAFVFRLLGLSADSEKVTEEEIKALVSEGAKGGEVQEVEQDIVERVFLLGDLKVSSLMTHRTDIVYLDLNMDCDEIRKIVRRNLYEYYPVIRGSLDTVAGIVSLKNLIFRLEENEFELKSILGPVTYFHENMSVYNVLGKMKEKHISQALVCDEFGSCQGIITLKDILGGLVGTLNDAEGSADIVRQGEKNEWIVEGQCPLYDFLSYFNCEELFTFQNDYITVGGLLMDQLNGIPVEGDCVGWKNFNFRVNSMEGARIDKILVRLVQKRRKMNNKGGVK